MDCVRIIERCDGVLDGVFFCIYVSELFRVLFFEWDVFFWYLVYFLDLGVWVERLKRKIFGNGVFLEKVSWGEWGGVFVSGWFK